VVEIFKALFPCASITGAPKVQTSRIIRDLEPGPRGIYTGALGYIGPDRKARFQVAIRTAWLDLADGVAEYGTGSGIVWDSDPVAEYIECRVKTRTVQPEFRLIETLLYVPGEGLVLRAGHVRRLERSARELGFIFDRQAVAERLDAVRSVGFLRVRLLLDESGFVELEAAELEADPRNPVVPWRMGLTVGPVASSDPLLRHKTTRRGVYERARAEVPEVDEVLLYNERGELTEGTFTNLVLEMEGRKWTPPLECGLLPGVFREKLLAEGVVQERVLRSVDLARAERVWLINSVRGWIPVIPAADSFS
jgi:para-aminobenzoate synthetase / 4-amino-4-deoxychorismate lyase